MALLPVKAVTAFSSAPSSAVQGLSLTLSVTQSAVVFTALSVPN